MSSSLDGARYGLNTMFVLFGAFSVFFMQIGFAMFVAGVVRAKNMSSILLKSAIDTVISAVCYFTVGYAFTLGDNGHPNAFIGNGNFALSSSSQSYIGREIYIWGWVFCAASTTIMAGSVAERCTFASYTYYAVFYAAWVYPVVGHWYWAPNGWLSPFSPNAIVGMGCIDFAGSGVVHTLGGFAALVGSVVLGPRVGRFADGADPREYRNGHNPPLYLMGSLLLWYGWFSFNAVSLLQIDTVASANIVARTSSTTVLAAAASGIVTILLVYWRTKTWNMLSICSGVLGGLVSITAGCSVVEPWAALICGAVAAPCVAFGEDILDWLKIDDPAYAFSIHGLSGIWGVLFVGLLAKEDYVVAIYNKPRGQGFMGIFYGGHGQILLCQFIAIVVTIAWVCFWIYGFFTFLNYMGVLRVALEEEAMGLDAATMGQGYTHQSGRVTPNATKTPNASYTGIRQHTMNSRGGTINTSAHGGVYGSSPTQPTVAVTVGSLPQALDLMQLAEQASNESSSKNSKHLSAPIQPVIRTPSPGIPNPIPNPASRFNVSK